MVRRFHHDDLEILQLEFMDFERLARHDLLAKAVDDDGDAIASKRRRAPKRLRRPVPKSSLAPAFVERKDFETAANG